MGRPKLENPLTNTERKKQWTEKNKENKDETEKKKRIDKEKLKNVQN